MTARPFTASWLVASGRCTPRCLLATEAKDPGTCACPCDGAFHAALAGATVMADVELEPTAVREDMESLLDLIPEQAR